MLRLPEKDGRVAMLEDHYNQAITNPFDGSEVTIGRQHWAANFMQWYEAYSNWRRTGYPDLTPVNYTGNVSGGQISGA